MKNITLTNVLHCVTQHLALRGSVDVKPAFVLDVEHQVTSIQVLHDEEEVLLCKEGQRGERETTSGEVFCGVWSTQQSL